MTAELVVALPAAILVLALCLGGVRLGVQAVQTQDAAATAARMLVRGNPTPSAAHTVAGLVRGATLQVDRSAGLVCATVTAPSPVATLPVPSRGRACALE